MSRFLRGSTVFVALFLLAISPGVALAHERRTVGNYQLVVGFNTEPALQGEPNGVQLTVTAPNDNNRAVDGLADTLKVAVAYGGGAPRDFKLRSVFGTPGRYIADLIPTRAGTYIFTFTGTIEGTRVNERFESGPGRFNDVEAVDALQFPEAIPPANEAVRQARAASEDAAEAQAQVAQARTMGVAAISVGVLGILLGAAALAVAARRR
jgi:hypothetical protein